MPQADPGGTYRPPISRGGGGCSDIAGDWMWIWRPIALGSLCLLRLVRRNRGIARVRGAARAPRACWISRRLRRLRSTIAAGCAAPRESAPLALAGFRALQVPLRSSPSTCRELVTRSVRSLAADRRSVPMSRAQVTPTSVALARGYDPPRREGSTSRVTEGQPENGLNGRRPRREDPRHRRIS